MQHGMTTPDLPNGDGIEGDLLASVGRHHSRTGALALAATEVVVRRLQLGGAAMVWPATADHAEFARIVPEKARAFADAGTALIDQTARITGELVRLALDEASRGAAATVSVCTSGSPAGLVAAQADAARAWLGQWLAGTSALLRLTLEAQGAVMAPIHRAATANVERLRA